MVSLATRVADLVIALSIIENRKRQMEEPPIFAEQSGQAKLRGQVSILCSSGMMCSMDLSRRRKLGEKKNEGMESR